MAKHHLLHPRAPVTRQEHAAIAAYSRAEVVQELIQLQVIVVRPRRKDTDYLQCPNTPHEVKRVVDAFLPLWA